MNGFPSKRPALLRWFLVSVAATLAIRAPGAALAESFRQRIEADWAQQDECRMIQIRQRDWCGFAAGELMWEGLPDAGRADAGRLASRPEDGRARARRLAR